MWILLLLVIITSGACQTAEMSAVSSDDTQPEQQPIAVVNGVELFEYQFENYLALAHGELYEDPMSELPKRQLFREFVVQELLLSEAQKEQFSVSDDELHELRSEWINPENPEEEEIVEHIRDYLVSQRFLHQKVRAHCEVSLGEMQSYYASHYDDFIVDDQVSILEIVVNSREEVETLANLTKSAEIRVFREMARRHSKGISASKGGDLGFFSRGELPEKFEEVIFNLKPGEISKPVESIQGFHLFLVEEKLPGHPQKFYEVSDQIFRELTASKERSASESYLGELLAKAEIKIYDESLEFRHLERKKNDRPAK
jgi:peptidyl-prolyl cis-trans isomerase C